MDVVVQHPSLPGEPAAALKKAQVSAQLQRGGARVQGPDRDLLEVLLVDLEAQFGWERG